MAKPPERNAIEVGFAVPWLAKALRVTEYHVRNRIADLKPKGRAGKANLYDLEEAVKAIVRHEVDWEKQLKSLKKSDLPVSLQTEYWAAQSAEQKFRREAGELWETNAVFDAFSDVFSLIRERVRVWSESLERESGLTAEQRRLLSGLTDELLDDLRTEIVKAADKHTTKPMVATLEEGLDGG